MTADLSYTQSGLFTRFYANTADGEYVWREMAKEDGIAAVLNRHAKSVISQIRAQGYTVNKEPKSSQTIDDILKELEA